MHGYIFVVILSIYGASLFCCGKIEDDPRVDKGWEVTVSSRTSPAITCRPLQMPSTYGST